VSGKRLFSRLILHFAFWAAPTARRAGPRANAGARMRARSALRQTLRFSRQKCKKMLADFQEMLTMTA
jgi:hypothetical protein